MYGDVLGKPGSTNNSFVIYVDIINMLINKSDKSKDLGIEFTFFSVMATAILSAFYVFQHRNAVALFIDPQLIFPLLV